MATTLKDIARDAGVALSTVSYVISGAGVNKVSEATRRRILASAAKLDYHPNITARGLSRGRTFTVGVLLESLAGSFTADVVAGLEEILEEKGYGLLLAGYRDEADLRRKCAYLWQRRVDAAAVFPAGWLRDAAPLAELVERSVPMVTVAGAGTVGDVPSVRVDPEAIGRLAAAYLLERGHTRLAYAGPADAPRLRAIRRALRRVPGASCDVFGHRGNYDFSLGAPLFAWVASLAPRPTAVVVDSDFAAMALIREAAAAGWSLPRDLSVMGVDGLAIGGASLPALTSVGQPTHDQGRSAGRLLLDGIEGRRAAVGHVFEPWLIERESCAPVRRRAGAPALMPV